MTASIFVIMSSPCRSVRVLQPSPGRLCAAASTIIALFRLLEGQSLHFALPNWRSFPNRRTASLYRSRQSHGNRNYLSCLSGFVIAADIAADTATRRCIIARAAAMDGLRDASPKPIEQGREPGAYFIVPWLAPVPARVWQT